METGTDSYKIWFFAGGETRENKFNVFTGSFIRLMKEILNDDFDYVKGIYFPMSLMNVGWALNNAQYPLAYPERNRITSNSFNQIVRNSSYNDQIILIASSAGTIAAAQAACHIAWRNSERLLFRKPLHIVLGASMISPRSDLFKKLLEYRKTGLIGEIIHDEIQDEGDNTFGVGGVTKKEAWTNAAGLILPVFSRKFHGPSFPNTSPENGHLHRKRSQTTRKALDYIDMILVKKKLAGEYYCREAIKALDSARVAGVK